MKLIRNENDKEQEGARCPCMFCGGLELLPSCYHVEEKHLRVWQVGMLLAVSWREATEEKR